MQYIMILLFLGFVTGVLIVGLQKENLFLGDEILNQDFMLKMQEINVDKRALFFLCLGKRLRAFFLLILLAYSSVNKFFVTVFFGFHGFYIGSILEILAIRYGMQGLLFYLGFIFPQGIFYAVGFLSLGCWCLNGESWSGNGIRRKAEKIRNIRGMERVAFAMFLILIGIFMEGYVNVYFVNFLKNFG